VLPPGGVSPAIGAASRAAFLPVIVLGLILLILGYVLHISVLVTIGIVLLIIGLVLFIAGATGNAVAGRRYWY
jgi:hypothetical protein